MSYSNFAPLIRSSAQYVVAQFRDALGSAASLLTAGTGVWLYNSADSSEAVCAPGYFPFNGDVRSGDYMIQTRVGGISIYTLQSTAAQALSATLVRQNAISLTGVSPGETGYRTALWGDSMTSQYNGDTVSSAATYDSVTGILAITSASHLIANGALIYFYNLSVPAFEMQRYLPATFIDVNNVSFNVGPGLAPTGSVASTFFLKNPRNSSANSWINWFNIFSGQRFNVIYNAAASGATSRQCLLNVDALLNAKPQVVFVQIPGINDWGTGGLTTEDESWNNVVTALQRILASGAKIVVLPVTPVRTGESRATLATMSRVVSFRHRLMSYAKDKPSLILYDSYKKAVDPASTTGLSNTTYITSKDNIHYSCSGAIKLGADMWSVIGPSFPNAPASLPASLIDCFNASSISLTSISRDGNGVVTATSTAHGVRTGETYKLMGGTSEVFNDYYVMTAPDANTLSFNSAGTFGPITGTILASRNVNLLPNPIFTTATGGTLNGGVTGVAPSKVNVNLRTGTGTVVASVPAHPDGFGNQVQLVITPSASCAIRTTFQDTAGVSFVGMASNLRWYYFEVELDVSGVSGSNLSDTIVQCGGVVDGNSYSAAACPASGFVPYITDDFKGVFRTGILKLPAGTYTGSSVFVEMAFSASGSALTVKMGRVRFVEVLPS